MHPSSLENMGRCIRRHLTPEFLGSRDRLTVLDVGGANVNGSYRDCFDSAQLAYTAADLAAGDGIDIVLSDPYRIPVEDGAFDVVVSGQMLEHCEFFWLAFAEMLRVVKRDGFIFLIAPSAGRIHRYPVDCYRFYPDAYQALAKYTKCTLVECWLDTRGPWNDLVGVFRHTEAAAAAAAAPASHARGSRAALGRCITWAPADPTDRPQARGSAEEERVSGQEPCYETLARIHQTLQPPWYVEIGVRNGKSLRLARGKAIGVDPGAEIADSQLAAKVWRQTSDDFFAETAETVLTAPCDLAFIDGMHLFEYALRDFMHLERRAGPASLIVIDDICPNHPAQASRFRRTRIWTGDVWRVHACLARRRPDLLLVPLDAHPTGLLLALGLDPTNLALWDQYNPTVREALSGPPDPPAGVLSRKGALAPTDKLIHDLLSGLRKLREQHADVAMVHKFLAPFRSQLKGRSPF